MREARAKLRLIKPEDMDMEEYMVCLFWLSVDIKHEPFETRAHSSDFRREKAMSNLTKNDLKEMCKESFENRLWKWLILLFFNYYFPHFFL